MPNKTVDEIRAELDKPQPNLPAPPRLGLGQSLGLGFAGANNPEFQRGVVSPMIAQRQNFGADKAEFEQGQREAQIRGLNDMARTNEISRRTDIMTETQNLREKQYQDMLKQRAQMLESLRTGAQAMVETDLPSYAGAAKILKDGLLMKAGQAGEFLHSQIESSLPYYDSMKAQVDAMLSDPDVPEYAIEGAMADLDKAGDRLMGLLDAGTNLLSGFDLAQARGAGGGMTPKDTETYRASAQMLEGAQLLEKLLTDPESDIMFLGRPGGAIEGGWLPGWAQNSIDYIARLGEESPDGKSRYERNAMIDAMMGDIGGMFTVERGGKALTGTEIKIFGGAIPQISENPIKNIAAVRQIASFARGRMEAIEMGAQIGIAREQFRDTESFTQALRSRGINVPTVEGHNEDGSFIMSSGASAPAADNIEFRQEIPGGGGVAPPPPPPARESPSFAPLDQSRMGQASEAARRSVAPVSPVGSLVAPIGAAAGAAAEGVHRTLVPGVNQPSQPGLLGPVDPGVARTLAAQARKKRGQ